MRENGMLEAGIMKQFLRERILRDDHVAREDERERLMGIANSLIGDTYIEEDPSVAEWFRSLVPTKADAVQYVHDLFPSAQWTRRYNLHWLLGDAIAGVTVGLVVVPQAMAYALLARLPPAYGLYTTFTGACLYWVFGTSKDVVIGTTAIGSLLVGQVIAIIEETNPGVYEAQKIAHAISFLSGGILLVLGLFRLGWIIEFISYIPISAFVTSASITIISTQLPTVLGISGINTRESPYRVYIKTLQDLGNSKLDAAIGLSSIVLLFAIQKFCGMMGKRASTRKKMWDMLNSLRLTFTILLYTLISYLVHLKTPSEGPHKFRIVGKIEKGFSHAGVPKMDSELFGLVAKELPAIVIILIVEHIAIAKNFGRMYGYKVVPSQEILAQGAANILSPFVGGYVCTGSFGASAVLTKAGVRTPLAGLFSAMVLVLALYALTAVFFYIPNAALAGLIIHATWNLITPPNKLFRYWKFSPTELAIWIIGVLVAIFHSLETSIYVGIGLSFATMLIRMARLPGKFSGRVNTTRIINRDSEIRPHTNTNSKPESSTTAVHKEVSSSSSSSLTNFDSYPPFAKHKSHLQPREVYLPLPSHPPVKEAHNPSISITPPHPGVFIYRFSETFNYINQANHTNHLLTHIQTHTRRTQTDDGTRPQDRLWCDNSTPTPPRKSTSEKNFEHDTNTQLPILRAVVLDLSTVNIIDMTSVQGLVDMRDTLRRWAAPETVEYHFAGVHNRWTRRALWYAGFGRPSTSTTAAADTAATVDVGNWCPEYTVATYFVDPGAGDEKECVESRPGSSGEDGADRLRTEQKGGRLVSVFGVDRPFFHVDLGDAVDAAVRNAREREARDAVVLGINGEV